MKAHTNKFKEEIKIYGRQLNSIISYTIDGVDYELGVEELNSITPHFESSILKSAMRGLEIDSNVEIPKHTVINYQFGVKVRESEGNDDGFDYINYGDYIVKDVEKQEDTNSYRIVAYDFMLKSMIDYEAMNITYPITIRDYINAICEHLGLSFKNIDDTFPNYNRRIQNELYLDSDGKSLGYTFRDVFDELSAVTASTICIDLETNEVEVRYLNYTGKNIFDKNKITTNKYLNNNGNLIDNSFWAVSDYIKVNPNEIIYYNGLTQTGTAPYSAYYDKNKNYVSSFKQQTGNNNITIPNNVYYVRFSISISSSTYNINTFQVERNENTDYEPYGLDTINEEFLKDNNVNFSEMFGPINTIVLSRAGESDNIYKSIPENLPDDEKIEIKIVDNQIMNFNDRADYLPDILNELYGLQYSIHDFSSTGICYYDICDRYNVQIGENTYSCIMFNDEVDITQGLEENIYTDMPENTTIDYTKADKDDRKINKAYIMVDKQNGIIEELVDKTVIVSDTKTGNGNVQIENAYEGILYKLSISGNISLLFPQNENDLYGYPLVPSNTLTPSNELTPSSPAPYQNGILYPNSSLYPKDTTLLIDDVEYKLDFDFLNYMSSTVHDEFVYENGTCKIIRRVGIDENGNMYALDNEIIQEREPIELYVKKDSIIQLKSFDNTILSTTYLLENEYTDVFATHVDVKSEIKLTEDSINLEVGKKFNSEDFTGANIMLEVNKDGSQAKINANKIELEGYTTINGNFKIDENGDMEVNNGTFNGLINAGKISVKGYTDLDPYILVGDIENDGGVHPYGSTIWDNGITVADYRDGGLPTIRTETSHNYAELSGGEVNAFGFNNISVAEKKKDFELLKSGLDILKEIDVYKYFYKNEKKQKKHIGVVIGEEYKYSKDITTDDNKEIDLYSFISVCCKAIQEQQEEIENLEKEMEELKNGFDRISK